jgi:hypothetical protein
MYGSIILPGYVAWCMLFSVNSRSSASLVVSYPAAFQAQCYKHFSLLPMHATRPIGLILPNLIILAILCEPLQIMKLSSCNYLSSPVTSSLFRSKFSILFSNVLNPCYSLMGETKFHTHTTQQKNYSFMYFNL